jgi:flagellar motor switch protein FliG
MANPKDGDIKVDGKKEAALLLGSLDQTHRERILKEIAVQNPELAAQLRKGLFSFQQVLALESIEIQKVIRLHPPRLFALALRGLEPDLKLNLFSKFSERQARAMEEEIQSMGPQKLSDVKQAQEKIIELARELHEKGEIQLK